MPTRGKNQLELLNQQARLSKAQRQLGALVYSLHKAGEENQPLVDKYIEAIAEIEKNIEEIKARMTPAERAEAEADAQPVEEPESGEPQAEDPRRGGLHRRGCGPSPRRRAISEFCHSEVDAEALFCNHCGAQL